MTLEQRFAENLFRLRKQADLSQEQLAERAGLHRTAIGLLEKGARVPRIDTLIKLAAALRVEAADLLDGIEWTPGATEPGRFLSDAY
jgi:transcriptional regulator with XRE-family HTH domain